MRLLGLDATLLALTLLVSGLALLWLYLQRQPPRRVLVPMLALWDALVPGQHDLRPGRPRVRQRRSLLLALAIAACLTFALGDPAPPQERAEVNLLLVLDCSASMGARDVSPSRIELAKARARARVSQLGPDDHAWVAALADGITLLTARTSSHRELLSAIDALVAREASADLGTAAEVAADLLAPFERAELALFSDGALEGVALARRTLARLPRVVARLTQVGTSPRNVAITQLSARPDALDHTHQAVFVAVKNFGAQAEPLTLRVHAGEVLLHEERLTLAGDETSTRVLDELPVASAPLRAQLVLARGADALRSDDQAELARELRAPTRVLLVSGRNRYLEAALLLDDTLEVRQIGPATYQSANGYDVVIFDGVLPQAPPQVAALYVGPIASTGAFPLPPAAGKPELVRPFFDHVAKAHPLLRELSLSDVNVSRASAHTLLPGDLALAETRAHDPLIVIGSRADIPFVALTFDLRDSDLPLRPAFPLFFLRTLDLLSGSRHALRTAASSTLRQQEGRIAPRADLFAVPPARATTADANTKARWLAPLRSILIGLALALLVLEWLAFHRRWTA